MRIPNKLVSFYHDSNLPNKMKENINDWIETNPNLDIKIFNLESASTFILENFNSDINEAFKILKPYSYKSDLFRFCYIYKHGGIYVDVKYKQMNDFKFENLLDKEHLVEEPIGIQSCLLALNEKNPLILNCIEDVVKNTLSYDYGYTPILTGPIPLSDNYLKFYSKNSINDLSWNIENHLQTIKTNNKTILQQYTEYRDELSGSDQPHYEYLYWNKDIYHILNSNANMPSDEDILYYLKYYKDLTKEFNKDISKGRLHWFQYGKREGRKINFSEEEKSKLLNKSTKDVNDKNIKKCWQDIIKEDCTKTNPVNIVSKRKGFKNQFMFIHKSEDNYTIKLINNDKLKQDPASQFILNKFENGYCITSFKYPEITMNVLKRNTKYELKFSKISELLELGVFDIKLITENRLTIKIDNFSLDTYIDNKKGKIRLTKSKDPPHLYGGWALFDIIES